MSTNQRGAAGNEGERRETSAGGVVFRRSPAGIDVVVARQRDRLLGEERVRLPKGRLDAGESPEEAALREVAEETGVRARITGRLEEITYVFREQARSVEKRVHFYLMQWLAGDPTPVDGEMSEAFWCPIDEAVRLLSFDTERRVVEEARARLERTG